MKSKNRHIQVLNSRVGEFLRAFPEARELRPDGIAFTVVAIPTDVWIRDENKYRNAIPCINYVKITGSICGQPLSLFVKETSVQKVLEALSDRHMKTVWPSSKEIPPFSVTMRKVRIQTKRRTPVIPIVEWSMKQVGLAA